MTPEHALLFAAIAFVVSILFTILVAIPNLSKAAAKLSIGAVAISLLAIAGFYTILTMASAHGAYGEPMTIPQTLRAIKHSPIEDEIPKLPEDLCGKVILYYRFGCPDCEAIHEDIMERISVFGDDVYWVSTRSEQGIELRKTYPCDHVPSVVYISINDSSDAYYARLDSTMGETVRLDAEIWDAIEARYARDHAGEDVQHRP